jgi:uncharacterized membrane protein YqhA
MGLLEKIFEGGLWRSRFVVILAVIFSMLGAIALFVVASADIWGIVVKTVNVFINHEHPEHFHEDLVGTIIGAIDLYLIAVVLLIFSFGIYELFVSKIDEAEGDNSSKILQISSLDELKSKLGNVIVMVLIVSFFRQIIHMEFTTALEMLYVAISILGLAVSLYFLHKGHH